VATIDAYLTQLASADPTPGGGSAACLVGAMGAALCAMVARISADAPRLAAMREDALRVVAESDELRARFLTAQADDEAAYGAVVNASALPKTEPSEAEARTRAIQAALAGAADAPLRAAALAAEGFALAARAAELGNKHLASDVECALHFYRAALAGSHANVRINHRFLRDEALVSKQEARMIAIDHGADLNEKRALTAIR